MSLTYYMLFSFLYWIYSIESIQSLDVILERANLSYTNPKYIFNVTANVRRYSRKSRYYFNLMANTKHTWSNNVTVALQVSQFLHNEYRRSFVEMTRKLCDLVNNEPYVGGALKNSGVVCPLPPGIHNIMNMTSPSENFPNVFPFEKGRLEFLVTITDTKELVMQLFIEASFKQKLKNKQG